MQPPREVDVGLDERPKALLFQVVDACDVREPFSFRLGVHEGAAYDRGGARGQWVSA